MFIWTVQDAIAGTLLAGAVLVVCALLIFNYARFFWKKLFSRKSQ